MKTDIHTMIVVRTLAVVLTHCLTWFVTGVMERADGMFVLIVIDGMFVFIVIKRRQSHEL